MNFNDYQVDAHSTALYEKGIEDFDTKLVDVDGMATAESYPYLKNYLSLVYASLKLNGEAGEVAELIGKALRDDGGTISTERAAKLEKEVGDVLWYLAEICTIMGWELSEVAAKNLKKLAKRQEEGTLHGDGSER